MADQQEDPPSPADITLLQVQLAAAQELTKKQAAKLEKLKGKGKKSTTSQPLSPPPGTSASRTDAPSASSDSTLALLKTIITALFVATADDASKSQKLQGLFGDVTGEDVDQLSNDAQDVSDVQLLSQHGIGPDMAPPSRFGVEHINYLAQKWVLSAINLKRSAKKHLSVEDYMKILRSFMHHHENRFSEEALTGLMRNTLPDEMASTMDGHLTDKKPFRAAWVATLLEHRAQLAPTEATKTLCSLTHDFKDDPLSHLKTIRQVATYTSTDRSSVIQTALTYCTLYLTALGLDEFQLQALLHGDRVSHSFGDPWTTLYMACRLTKGALESLRQVRVRGSCHSVQALSVDTDTCSSFDPQPNKEIQKLNSSLGLLNKQSQHQDTRIGALVAHVQQIAHWATHSNSAGEVAALSAGDVAPQRPIQDAVFYGKCLLCMEPDHSYRNCPFFPDGTPASFMCWCMRGAHTHSVCPFKQYWPPQDQQDWKQMACSGVLSSYGSINQDITSHLAPEDYNQPPTTEAPASFQTTTSTFQHPVVPGNNGLPEVDFTEANRD